MENGLTAEVKELLGKHDLDVDKLIKALRPQIDRELRKQAPVAPIPTTYFKKLDLDDEIYDECKKKDVSLSQYLEEKDPSGNYPAMKTLDGKEIKLDAFERQCAARGLSISGPNAAKLEGFYEVPGNRVLFPEFINRNVRIGQLMPSRSARVADMIATESSIDSGVYQAATADGTGDFSLKRTPQGTQLPTVTVKVTEAPITLAKYGRLIKGTYEYLRRVKVNVFGIVLQFIGMQLEIDQAAIAVDVLINGNTGNNNAAPQDNIAVTGAFTYKDFEKFLLKFGVFDVQLWIVTMSRAGDILDMAEFKDPLVFQFQRTGELISPFGKQMKLNEGVGDNDILGVDTRFALEKVTEIGSQMTEANKLIDQQWQEIAISEVVGFAKIFASAARNLNITF